jgi:hypothetical protein
MFPELKKTFVPITSMPIRCGIAVEYNLRTYVLVHVEGEIAYILSITGDNCGEKYKVALNNIIKSPCDVCFAM